MRASAWGCGIHNPHIATTNKWIQSLILPVATKWPEFVFGRGILVLNKYELMQIHLRKLCAFPKIGVFGRWKTARMEAGDLPFQAVRG